MVLAFHSKTQLKHMCTHINTMSMSVHTRTKECTQRDMHTHTHRLSHQSHCFSFSLSCPINKTTYNSLQHIIRIERRYYQRFYALTDTSPFKVRTKSLDRVQKPGLSLSGAKNPRRYTAILWENIRQANKQQWHANNGRFPCLMTTEKR